MNAPGRFVREFVAFSRGRIALATALLAAAALVEAFGLVVLVELVRILGLDVQSGSLAGAGGAASAALRAVGLTPSFTVVLLTYVAAVAVRGSIERIQTRLNHDLESGFVAAARARLYRALTYADWNFHARSHVADAVHALTHQADRAGAAAFYALQMVAASALAAVYLALALWTSPGLTAVVVASGVVLFVGLRRPARAAAAAGEASSLSTERLYRAIAEHFSSVKTARSYNALDRHVVTFEALSREVTAVGARMVHISSAVRQRLELGSVLLLALLLFLSRQWLRLPVGETLVLMFVFARLMPRLKDILVQGTSLLGLLPAFAAMGRLEDDARAAAEPAAEPGAATVPFDREVRLEDVRFEYPDRSGVPAVASVGLRIRSGQTVAIVGPSGAGKSTIADLVMGLLRPESGRVTVDGVDVASRAAAWRQQIGYVSQDTFLFHDTVRANLLWAEPGATESAMWEALGQAAAADFVRSLPAGLDTIVGDRGVLLSGGERQRVALARALLRHPKLLILDEATSALDADNEARVLSAVAALHGRMAIVIITHRLSAVRGADFIHVLEAGRVVEQGTAADLARPGTRFHRLCQMQGVDLMRVAEPPDIPVGR